MVYGYVSGGIASEATGGDFLVGAATGAIVALANHGLHGGNKEQKISDLESGIRKVLGSAKVGEKITRDDLINKYGVPKNAARLINSFTLTSKSSITVDWNGLATTAVEMISSAKFKDGTLNIKSVELQRPINFKYKDGSSLTIKDPLNISGGAIGIKVGKSVDWDIYLEGNNASPNLSFKSIYGIGN